MYLILCTQLNEVLEFYPPGVYMLHADVSMVILFICFFVYFMFVLCIANEGKYSRIPAFVINMGEGKYGES